MGEPVTFVTLEQAPDQAQGPWRYWWLGIVLLSLVLWGGIFSLAALLRNLL